MKATSSYAPPIEQLQSVSTNHFTMGWRALTKHVPSWCNLWAYQPLC